MARIEVAYFRQLKRGQSKKQSRELAMANAFLKLADDCKEGEWVTIRWFNALLETDGNYQTMRFTIESMSNEDANDTENERVGQG